MEIYKFGGASVKDADGVKNVFQIVKQNSGTLVVVVSAMGKTTNLLEDIWKAYRKGEAVTALLEQVVSNHHTIIHGLGIPPSSNYLKLFTWFVQLFEAELAKEPGAIADADYDRIVSYGELFSTAILSAYFHEQNTFHQWLDARKLIKTTEDYREGVVQWQTTKELIQYNVNPHGCRLYITQGFVASADNEKVITLGREGSDYTAAIFANALEAEKMTIWKDVPGVMNADPRKYQQAELIDEMTYKEAVEMSYFGANVIHPKTLKPLENARIPLWVRSFLSPEQKGTLIHKLQNKSTPKPILITKDNQALITLMPKDFSFMQEQNLTYIFKTFQKFRIKVNIMEKAALSFTACVDYQERSFAQTIKVLSESFTVKYNENLKLLTIRHYTPELIQLLTGKKESFMEQQNRDTAWFVQKQDEV